MGILSLISLFFIPPHPIFIINFNANPFHLLILYFIHYYSIHPVFIPILLRNPNLNQTPNPNPIPINIILIFSTPPN
jgi:hypothetical protein